MGGPTLTGILLVVLLSVNCEAALRVLDKIKNFFNPFGYTLDLGECPSTLKYSYVLIRSGFRPPDNTVSNTFPSDVNYSKRWRKGKLTSTGEKMAKMLGRSLEDSRYETAMTLKWVERTKPVQISSVRKQYAVDTGEAFEEGLLNKHRDKMNFVTVHSESFDKTELFENSALCPAYDNMRKMVQDSQEKAFLQQTENQQFLAELRQFIGAPQNTDDQWYINSLKKVYWLYEILAFEKATKNRKPKWMNQSVQDKIHKFVFEYLRQSIHGEALMAKFLIGPLLSNILEKDEDGYTRLHVHVTDERIFAAFKSMIFQGPATPAEFGEMIMFEADLDGTVEVLNLIPTTNKFMKIPVPFRTLDEFKAKLSNYLLPNNEWSAACSQTYYGSETSKPPASQNPAGWTMSTDTDTGGYNRFKGIKNRDIDESQDATKSSYSAYPVLHSTSPSVQKRSYSATDDNVNPPTNTFWYDSKWNDRDISREEYFEMAKRNGKEKDSISKGALVRPIVQSYTPWRPAEEDDTSYSSDEEPLADSRDKVNPDRINDSPIPSRTGSDLYGRVGTDETRAGGLASVTKKIGGRSSDDDNVRYSSDRYSANRYVSDRYSADRSTNYDKPTPSNDALPNRGNRFPFSTSPFGKNDFTQSQILPSQLSSQSNDFKDGHDYFENLPKRGVYGGL